MDVPMPAPKPAIVSKYEPMPLPRLGVAAKPFRSGSYHAGHNCPNCGNYQPWTSRTLWDEVAGPANEILRAMAGYYCPIP